MFIYTQIVLVRVYVCVLQWLFLLHNLSIDVLFFLLLIRLSVSMVINTYIWTINHGHAQCTCLIRFVAHIIYSSFLFFSFFFKKKVRKNHTEIGAFNKSIGCMKLYKVWLWSVCHCDGKREAHLGLYKMKWISTMSTVCIRVGLVSLGFSPPHSFCYLK